MAVAIGTAEDAGRSAPATSQVGGTRTTRSHEPRRTAVVRHPSGAGQTLRTRGTDYCLWRCRTCRARSGVTRGSWAYTQYGIPRLVRPHGGPTNAQPRIAIRHSANVPVRGPAPAARRAPRPPRRAPAGAPAHARSAALKRFPRRPDPRRPGPGPREGRSQTPRRAPAPAPIFVFFSSDERPARPRGGTVQPPDRRQPPRAAVDPASSVTAGRSGVGRAGAGHARYGRARGRHARRRTPT